MNTYLHIAADVVAIVTLTLIYMHRHRRRDLMTAFIAINIGVLAVTVVLSGAAATIGLGLGLFGVLSIIRLRSNELGQHEIAYYFAALALGLLGGLGTSLAITGPLMALVCAGVLVADSQLLCGHYRQQTVVLDRAIADETALTDHLELLLGARVVKVLVLKLDLVDDSTIVDVRFIPEERRASELATTPPALASVHG